MLGVADEEASSSPLSPSFPPTNKTQHRSHVKRASLISSSIASFTTSGSANNSKKTTKVKDASLPYSKRASATVLMRSVMSDMDGESEEEEELEPSSTSTDQSAKSAVTRPTASISTRRMKKMAERESESTAPPQSPGLMSPKTLDMTTSFLQLTTADSTPIKAESTANLRPHSYYTRSTAKRNLFNSVGSVSAIINDNTGINGSKNQALFAKNTPSYSQACIKDIGESGSVVIPSRPTTPSKFALDSIKSANVKEKTPIFRIPSISDLNSMFSFASARSSPTTASKKTDTAPISQPTTVKMALEAGVNHFHAWVDPRFDSENDDELVQDHGEFEDTTMQDVCDEDTNAVLSNQENVAPVLINGVPSFRQTLPVNIPASNSTRNTDDHAFQPIDLQSLNEYQHLKFHYFDNQGRLLKKSPESSVGDGVRMLNLFNTTFSPLSPSNLWNTSKKMIASTLGFATESLPEVSATQVLSSTPASLPVHKRAYSEISELDPFFSENTRKQQYQAQDKPLPHPQTKSYKYYREHYPPDREEIRQARAYSSEMRNLEKLAQQLTIPPLVARSTVHTPFLLGIEQGGVLEEAEVGVRLTRARAAISSASPYVVSVVPMKANPLSERKLGDNQEKIDIFSPSLVTTERCAGLAFTQSHQSAFRKVRSGCSSGAVSKKQLHDGAEPMRPSEDTGNRGERAYFLRSRTH